MPIIVPSIADCAYCGRQCAKIKTNTVKSGRYIYVNDVGGKWFRKICPACVPLANRDRKRDVASKIKDEGARFTTKKRRCPGCAIPTVNYYKCAACTPYRAASDMMDMWGVAL